MLEDIHLQVGCSVNTKFPQHLRIECLCTKIIKMPGGRGSEEPRHEYKDEAERSTSGRHRHPFPPRYVFRDSALQLCGCWEQVSKVTPVGRRSR